VEDRSPVLFLSSTLFDLRQVRADLVEFLEHDLGYGVLASEHATFPVDPSVDTIENCRHRVENNADALVLIIGSRYGHVPRGSSYSVTNIEYLAAKSRRLPIFTFIQRDVLALLPVWKANPNADFSGSVDTPNVFRFVEQVRESDGVWTFPFDTAQDIRAALRVQLAFQMARGLRLFAKLRTEDAALEELRGYAFRIAAERDDGWAPRLLAVLVHQELRASADLRRDHDAHLAIGVGERLKDDEVAGWLKTLSEHAIRTVNALKVVVERVLNDASNTEDIPTIRYGAKQIGSAYRDCLEWAARLRRAHVPEDWRPLLVAKSSLLDPILSELESFPPRIHGAVDEALAREGLGPHVLDLTLKLAVADTTRYYAELEQLRRRRGLR
jgi:hypothetical protein